jgi:hypothetical protein
MPVKPAESPRTIGPKAEGWLVFNRLRGPGGIVSSKQHDTREQTAADMAMASDALGLMITGSSL